MRDSFKVTAFDHVVLNVADVERSLRFYCDELGLEPLRVEEWLRKEVFFPSIRVDSGTIIDLLETERTGENVNHICLVVEPADFDAIGREAAKLASDLAARAPAARSGVPFRFVAGRVLVNGRTAQQLGLSGEPPAGAEMVR